MSRAGFTLIEIVAVLVLVAILAAVAYSRYQTSDLDIYARSAAIKNNIRYAQSLAMKQGRNLGASCDGANFWLFAENTGTHISLPDGSGSTLSLASVNVSMPAFTVCFDSWGRPYTSASRTTAWAAGNNPITITSTASGSTQTFSITPNTGYIP